MMRRRKNRKIGDFKMWEKMGQRRRKGGRKKHGR